MKKLFKGRIFNAGDRKEIVAEEKIEEVQFNVHKFTNRLKPQNTANIVIFPNFSEFGSELIECLYCLPMLLNNRYAGKYSIVMGWYGRSYLYKHLVDEFWEIKEEHQWLREYCRAFHHVSKNLKKIEKNAKEFGRVVDVSEYAIQATYPELKECSECKGKITREKDRQHCLTCGKFYPEIGFYNRIKEVKNNASWIPFPSQEKLDYVEKYVKPNSVGIIARNRVCYGRNLQPDFYEKLIILLEEMHYNIIWLGEKETTWRSPFPDRVLDYCLTEDARDLEITLALVSKLKFTIQFWTASTRLASLVNVPFILFESPDQIWGAGQEGIRLSLCSKSKYKLVISHFHKVRDNHQDSLNLVKKAINEMDSGNYEDLIGLVENEDVITHLRSDNLVRIGRFS